MNIVVVCIMAVNSLVSRYKRLRRIQCQQFQGSLTDKENHKREDHYVNITIFFCLLGSDPV
jgi:hypothetical protein